MVRESKNICVSIIFVILLDWEFVIIGGGDPTILLGSHQICRCPETRVLPKNDSTFFLIFFKLNISSPNGTPSFYTLISINLPNGGLTLLLFLRSSGLNFTKVAGLKIAALGRFLGKN